MSRLHLIGWAGVLLAGVVSVNSAAQAATKAERTRVAEGLTAEALHREIYGQQAERDRLLERAAAQAPDFAPAKWHRGLVQHRNQWIKAEELPNRLNSESRITDYRHVRDRYPATVEGQLELANWCAQRGLQDREQAHLTQVITLSPDHAEARRRLGYTRVGLDWVLGDEAREAAEETKQDQATLARWSPTIAEIRNLLHDRGQFKRQKAVERLMAIADPAAAGAIEAGLWNDMEAVAQTMIQALGAMTGHEASLLLARQAVVSPFAAVRDAAAKQLRARDLDSYAPALLSLMYTPATSQMTVFQTRDGRLFHRYVVQREGQNEQQSLVLDTFYRRVSLPGGDAQDTLGTALGQVQEANLNRELGVVQNNLRTMALNDRISAALNLATEQSLPANPEDWWQWWNETNEVYTEGTKPEKTMQLTNEVALVDRAPSISDLPSSSMDAYTPPPPMRMDCLAAGTLVWTDSGPAAIEAIRVGDLVLAQDPESGELAYKPVLRTTVRPLGRLIRVELATREVLETSGGHLFWVAGEGWKKARELPSGCELHGFGGTTRVSATDTSSEQETYNLIVADFHSYFAGEARVLCHDNTVRRPTNAVVPGLSVKR
jgi:hypothetical protein